MGRTLRRKDERRAGVLVGMSRSASNHANRALFALPAVALALAAGCGGSGYSGNSSSSSSSSSKPAGAGYGAPAKTKTKTKAASAPASGSGETIKLAADESGGLYFNPKTLTAKAGKATIVMTNPQTSGKPHGIAIQGQGLDKDGPVVSPGTTSTVQVTLKPGKYSYYCPVPAHKAAGMTGTLTVQ
jgi:plastocyanin